jgi:formylglycine-generating enzyme required for sulfatase activity/tRNA A-37 threonylcarbamoyl transferase component Bud32
MIKVTCAHCGISILVPSTVQGRVGICFGCGARIQVPRAANPEEILNITFQEGDRISDRYVIGKAIGSGGMGVVYDAHDELVDEVVALKFMNPRMLRTQRGQKLFIQEAQVARRLRHENIVAVHDVSSTTEGILYLSMEYIRGQSLRKFLRRHRKERRLVPVRLVVTLTSQILAALEYAHRTVIHRDIKPENVMLLPGEHVKVLDFGLAKAVDEEAVAPVEDPEKRQRVIGTLAYAAPEQRRHRPIDLRADLHSVGTVMHEMFTLRTPMDEPATVSQVRSDVSPSLLAVLDKAVQEEKEARWQSAAEFRAALEGAFEGSYRRVAVPNRVARTEQEVSTEGMVYLEGGSFLMGNDEVPDEAPEFEAFVEPFYMDAHPVTVGEYAAYLKATDAPEPKFWRVPELNGQDQPVVGVSWNEACEYAAWAGKQLPTEAQWEFAARGRGNRRYPWGHLDPDSTRCNFGDYLGMPSIVSMHEGGMTPEGIQDLAGNVYEWTEDAFEPYRHRQQGGGESDSPRRVVRGGSWHSGPLELVCSHRKGLFPESRLTTVGFRCVVPARTAH